MSNDQRTRPFKRMIIVEGGKTQDKIKRCINCHKKRRIVSRDMCTTCYRKTYSERYLIKPREKLPNITNINKDLKPYKLTKEERLSIRIIRREVRKMPIDKAEKIGKEIEKEEGSYFATMVLDGIIEKKKNFDKEVNQ